MPIPALTHTEVCTLVTSLNIAQVGKLNAQQSAEQVGNVDPASRQVALLCTSALLSAHLGWK